MTSIKKSTKSTASKNPGDMGAPDAIKLLKADHAEVKNLFDQFEAARSDSQKVKLATAICQSLTAHTTIEEEIFYPAIRGPINDDDMLDEAAVEHQSAKVLIAEIEAGSPGEDMWEAKVKVLGEYINHHVKEEEEEMFPKAKEVDVDLKELGAELLARKHELMAEVEAEVE